MDMRFVLIEDSVYIGNEYWQQYYFSFSTDKCIFSILEAEYNLSHEYLKCNSDIGYDYICYHTDSNFSIFNTDFDIYCLCEKHINSFNDEYKFQSFTKINKEMFKKILLLI
jgi:hypothetical protein